MIARGFLLSVMVAAGFGLTECRSGRRTILSQQAGEDRRAVSPGRAIRRGGPAGGEGARRQIGAEVIVENLPGAGGRTGAKAVAQATPDGYTLLLGGTNPNAIAVSIYRTHTFEPIGDFTPVGVIGIDSNALVVQPGRARSYDQGACRLCKSKPRQALGGRLARHRSARHAGIAPGAHRLRPGFHPLPGGRAGAHGLVGQSNSSRFHDQGGAASAHQGRQAPGARRDQQ